ncbi:hypothetical protein H5410_061830 [Solanum commersonii]|uniref:NB-ARC domain-containing protein n=1 Tax=Solanum commersonii TaxID=4109 RepID=A0A9J5WAD4_SOLCO|nr:hypothetical protein H5410_061830 [Solanum commersonii]
MTIARKLYNNDIIVSHFDVRAWCIISQTYKWRELLQVIFSQVTCSTDEGDRDDILADKLRKSLMGKRYLIVLDDMWDCMAWNDLKLSFLDVGNRSRIVVITRLEEVDESCELLQKKVFQKDDCPPELQDVSQEVVEKFKGFPLVIVLVAGILKKRKMEESWWNEDAIIPVSKLISLWIAEDFVQNIKFGRLIEEAAEGYLMDLISSNLVMVSERKYNGKVKYYQVHDVVLHFCLEKSREENFMLAVKGHYSQLQPFQWNESRVSFSFSKELSKFASLGSKIRKPLQQHLRSLITTNRAESYGWNSICKVSEVRLLKVLDLSSCGVRVLSSVTFKPLIHLKYLTVSTKEFDFHPEPHLPNLETLIMDGLSKHVEIGEAELDLKWENNKKEMSEESSKLENLSILRRVVIHKGDRVVVLLQRCPNLQQLDIIFSGDEDSVEICLKFESLTQLQMLRLSLLMSTHIDSIPFITDYQT